VTIQGITEDDIANYLAQTPGFFERHADLMASIQLTSPHGQRAVSLQERQMEMLRERNKGLELKIVEMIRHGQDNVAIADRLQQWTRVILLTTDARALPAVLVAELQRQFLIPQAALRLWSLDPAYDGEIFSTPVGDDVPAFASSLRLPYCGVNAGFEATNWLDAPTAVASTALIPLRHDSRDAAFGLLVLASPDPTRYAADMGTEFLARIGEIAGAGLSRLLEPV
jgi:uncharacterized protein YigA (DUF484 family)